MSASTVSNERRRFPRPPQRPRRGPSTDVDCRDGFGATLEDVVAATLAELAYSGRAACPVCAASELEPTGCNHCGSTLS
jgi:hypothetical protein